MVEQQIRLSIMCCVLGNTAILGGGSAHDA